MARGDAELAAVMRKLLSNDTYIDVQSQWAGDGHPFYVVVDGSAPLTEEEAHAVEEARRG